MKTNTFEHLENLCRLRRIVCERRHSRKIELTTPDGGTTAECVSVADALNTLHSDTAFSSLPLHLPGTKANVDEKPAARRVREAEEFKRKLDESDKRIREAMYQLSQSQRGADAILAWKNLVKRYAGGFDQANWYAFQTLVTETAAGRRDYLERI